MLVLTAYEDDRILLFDQQQSMEIPIAIVKVTLVENNKVRLGFEAADDIKILREKVWLRDDHNS